MIRRAPSQPQTTFLSRFSVAGRGVAGTTGMDIMVAENSRATRQAGRAAELVEVFEVLDVLIGRGAEDTVKVKLR